LDKKLRFKTAKPQHGSLGEIRVFAVKMAYPGPLSTTGRRSMEVWMPPNLNGLRNLRTRTTD
jgi:hypothetical protein